MNILVSIIVPCYNQAQYLDEALHSVLEQTYQDWECIIVNDGSPDNTEETAKKWLNRDSRFKYIYQDNAGLSAARNGGIAIAEGEIILPLDCDDKLGENYLDYAVAKFKQNENLKVVYCKAQYFGDKGGEWILPDFTLNNLAIRNVIFCSAFFKKVDWIRVGGYDVKMVYGLEDWEFWISVLKDGGDVFKIENVCFYYRVKKKSMVTDLHSIKLKKMYEYLSIKHVAFFVEQLGSFKHLISENIKLKSKLNNTKFLINSLFFKSFGFKIFNLSDI